MFLKSVRILIQVLFQYKSKPFFHEAEMIWDSNAYDFQPEDLDIIKVPLV